MDDTDESVVERKDPTLHRKRKKKRSSGSGNVSPVNVSVAGVNGVGEGSTGEAALGDVSAVFAEKMAAISAEMRALVLTESITKKAGKDVLDLAAKYEAIIVKQCSVISRLEGRLEERRESGTRQRESCVVATKAANNAGQPASASRPGPTFAVVVRSAVGGEETTAEDLKRKVLDLGRGLGPLKVKSVRTLRDGGVAVVTSSREDVRAIRAAPQFAAAGLALTDPKMGEPRLLVSDVPADVTNEKLIGEVLPFNFTGVATTAELAQCRVVSRMGKDERANVVMDVPKKLREFLVNQGRLYVGWNSCRVREYENVPQCYGCGSFGHLLARCTLGRLCHNCGGAGHVVGTCSGAAKCRNCTLRGLPADHRVTSVKCPCFVRESERRRDRVIG